MAQRDVRAALKALGGVATGPEIADYLLNNKILDCSRSNALSLVTKGMNRMSKWGEASRTKDGKWQLLNPSS
jgi:hypothetical protein